MTASPPLPSPVRPSSPSPTPPRATPPPRDAAGDAASLVATQMVAAASTFATGILLARVLGPSGKGFVDIVLASATLLQMVTGLSLASGIFYHTASAGVDARRLLRLIAVYALATGALVAAVLPLLARTRLASWALPSSAPVLAAWLVAGLLVLLQGQQLLQGVAKGQARFRLFGLSEVVARSGTLFLVAALALAAVAAPTPYVVAFGGATLASAALLWFSAHRAPSTPGGVPIRAILLYSLPLYLGNLVQFLNYRLDLFFVKANVGLDGVGRYTVAVWLAQTVWLVPNALAALVMRAAAAEPASPATLERTALLTRGCLALSALVATGIAILAGPGVRVVFGPAFAESVPALLLLLPGVVLFTAVVILSAFLNGLGRQVLTTYVACVSLVATVALNLWLVPRYGIAGAAMASTASYALSAVLTVAIVQHLIPELPARRLLLARPADVARVVAQARARFAPRGTR